MYFIVCEQVYVFVDFWTLFSLFLYLYFRLIHIIFSLFTSFEL